MNTAQTRCLVLKTSDYGESDKLVTIFSEDKGRVTGLAKGAKLSKKRFVNKLEPFSLLLLTYRQPRTGSLLFVQEADLESAHLTLRHRYDRYVGAIYICELVLKFTRERDPDEELYTLLWWALNALDQGERVTRIVALFHIRLLTTVGYQPDLTHCYGCSSPITTGTRYSLAAGNGTLLCDRCRRTLRDKNSRELPLQTLKFLISAQQLDLRRLGRLQLPDMAARQALETLHRYSSHLLQRDIHAWTSFASLFINSHGAFRSNYSELTPAIPPR